MSHSVLRMLIPRDYGQMILLPMMPRGRSLWDHLVGDLERLALSIIIRGSFTSYLIGLLFSKLNHQLLSISFSQHMFNNHMPLILLYNLDHYIREPSLHSNLNHRLKRAQDSSPHWALPLFRILRAKGFWLDYSIVTKPLTAACASSLPST